MRGNRTLLLVLGFVLVASLITGCGSAAEDATFLGYKVRPADDNTPGIAIVQLANGKPAEAECKYGTLEKGAPLKVEKAGDTYVVVQASPDWE